MRYALITTTINVPHVLREYRQCAEAAQRAFPEIECVDFFVAGDQISPHDDILALMKEIGGVYIHPKDQEFWASSAVIGWRSIQRRNIAILEAIKGGYDVIVTVDDDNIPLNDSYFGNIHALMRSPRAVPVIEVDTGWYNPARHLLPPVVHRGFPYSQRANPIDVKMTELEPYPIGVVAGMWLGDPDIDAMERLVNRPDVVGSDMMLMNGFALKPGTWSPFNSQNTAYRGDLAHLMMCWPGVGRFDDIWASYLARLAMDKFGFVVHYGQPFVRQERNVHDLWVDLDTELFGYKHTDELVRCLRQVDIEPGAYYLPQVYAELKQLDWLPSITKVAFDAWLEDVETAWKERDGARRA